ncbi:protein of unknown function [Pararobbsia alpina]
MTAAVRRIRQDAVAQWTPEEEMPDFAIGHHPEWSGMEADLNRVGYPRQHVAYCLF